VIFGEIKYWRGKTLGKKLDGRQILATKQYRPSLYTPPVMFFEMFAFLARAGLILVRPFPALSLSITAH